MAASHRANLSVIVGTKSGLRHSFEAASGDDLNKILDAFGPEITEEFEEEDDEDDPKKKFKFRRRIRPSAIPILNRYLIKDKFLRSLQRRFPDVQFHGLDTDGKTYWEYNITLPDINTTEERTRFIIDAKPQELFIDMRNWLRRVRSLPGFEPNVPWLQRLKIPGISGPPCVWSGFAGSFLYEWIFARQGPGLICRLYISRID